VAFFDSRMCYRETDQSNRRPASVDQAGIRGNRSICASPTAVRPAPLTPAKEGLAPLPSQLPGLGPAPYLTARRCHDVYTHSQPYLPATIPSGSITCASVRAQAVFGWRLRNCLRPLHLAKVVRGSIIVRDYRLIVSFTLSHATRDELGVVGEYRPAPTFTCSRPLHADHMMMERRLIQYCAQCATQSLRRYDRFPSKL
jgi:hypothetical protein